MAILHFAQQGSWNVYLIVLSPPIIINNKTFTIVAQIAQVCRHGT
jgi:hypothetical protein